MDDTTVPASSAIIEDVKQSLDEHEKEVDKQSEAVKKLEK